MSDLDWKAVDRETDDTERAADRSKQLEETIAQMLEVLQKALAYHKADSFGRVLSDAIAKAEGRS